MAINENVSLPTVDNTAAENCPNCDNYFHNHVFMPHRPAFNMHEEFYKTISTVNNTLAKVIALEEQLTHKVECMLSNVSSDNVEFKKLMTGTYNQFANTVKNEVNSFESLITNAFDVFKKTMETDFADYVKAFNSFKKDVNSAIADFEQKVEKEIQDINTYFRTNFNTTVRQELRTLKETGELDELIKGGMLDDYALISSLTNYATKQEVATERSRIDNLVANASSSDGNAELIDIRTDEYGTVHASAGESVRAQGTHAFNVRNALVYPGYMSDISIDTISAGGFKVTFNNTIHIVVRGKSSDYSNSWEHLTENISTFTEIGEDGQKCTIRVEGHNPALCYDTLTTKLKIVDTTGITKNDVVLFMGTYAGVTGGVLFPFYLYKRLGDNPLVNALRNKNNVFFYIASLCDIDFTKRNDDGACFLKFNNRICCRTRTQLHDLYWEEHADTLGSKMTYENEVANITLMPYERLIYRPSTGKLYVVYFNQIKEEDIPLINAGWAILCGGELMYWVNNTNIKKLNERLTNEVDAIWTKLNEGKYESVSSSKMDEFASIENSDANNVRFLFVTDPHTYEHDKNGCDANTEMYVNHLAETCKKLNLDMCIACGDWLNNQHTKNEAKLSLSYIGGVMRDKFDKFYNVVGNHDYNYQDVEDGVQVLSSNILSPTDIANAWRYDKTYYTFVERNTRFVVFDTGLDWENPSNIADNLSAQIPWFVELLHSNEIEHVGLIAHITYTNEDHTVITSFFTKILNIAKAFNERGTAVIDGVNYDFTDSNGMVQFVFSGHTHHDNISIVDGIPIINTTNMQNGGAPTYDLVNIDYPTGNINLIRVGTGENRLTSF